MLRTRRKPWTRILQLFLTVSNVCRLAGKARNHLQGLCGSIAKVKQSSQSIPCISRYKVLEMPETVIGETSHSASLKHSSRRGWAIQFHADGGLSAPKHWDEGSLRSERHGVMNLQRWMETSLAANLVANLAVDL